MKQLRRQEERAKKKQAAREMEEEQCTEYFEETSEGAVNAKGIKGKGKGNEEKKRERREEEEGSETISWHGEEETDSITYPKDLETAYEALKIKASTSDAVIVEDLLDKVEYLSSAGHPEDNKANSLELGEHNHSYALRQVLTSAIDRMHSPGSLRSHNLLRFSLLHPSSIRHCRASEQVSPEPTSPLTSCLGP